VETEKDPITIIIRIDDFRVHRRVKPNLGIFILWGWTCRSYSYNAQKATSRTFCIKAFLTATEVPINTMKTKLFNKACSTVNLLASITGNLEIIDIAIA
jgi:hypothetical protein